jgi:hypothetical protein
MNIEYLCIETDTLALALTGVLGVLSFVVQARASTTAARTQKESEDVRAVAETQRREQVQQAQVQMVRVGRWYGATAAHSCNVPALFLIIHTTVYCINLQFMCHR